MNVTTPYQKIKDSKPGQFVRHNKLATAAITTAGSFVLAGGAAQSSLVAKAAEYGVVPLVAGGVAVVGAAAVHDAFVNDLGEHNGRAAAKIGFGSLAALGGTQVVGDLYNIPVLDHALSTPAGFVADHATALAGLGVLGGSVLAGKFAFGQFSQLSGDQKLRHGALATGGAVASAAAGLGGVELIGRQFDIPGANRALTGTVEFLSQGRGGAVVGGAALVGAGTVLGNEAVQNFKKGGNDVITAAEGMGAATAALGGLELAGHGLGIQAFEGILTEHAAVVGGTAMSVGGLGLARESFHSVQKNGLTLGNSAGATVAGALLPGGIAVAAGSLGLSGLSSVAGKAAGVGASLGLGMTSVALARGAVNAGKQGHIGSAATQAVGATVAASGGLLLAGEVLNIEVIHDLAGQVADVTWKPLAEHVLIPSAAWLFENPIAGAVTVAASAGAYLYYRHKTGDGR